MENVFYVDGKYILGNGVLTIFLFTKHKSTFMSEKVHIVPG